MLICCLVGYHGSIGPSASHDSIFAVGLILTHTTLSDNRLRLPSQPRRQYPHSSFCWLLVAGRWAMRCYLLLFVSILLFLVSHTRRPDILYQPPRTSGRPLTDESSRLSGFSRFLQCTRQCDHHHRMFRTPRTRRQKGFVVEFLMTSPRGSSAAWLSWNLRLLECAPASAMSNSVPELASLRAQFMFWQKGGGLNGVSRWVP
jgi:hypothetical protein